jgi:hypothetical protein
VFASGGLAYVVDLMAGLRVFDVTDPASPTEVGSATLPDFANHVTVRGDHAFVANGGAGLRVVDVSDPAQPQVVGSLGSSNYVADVFVSGSHAYLADFGAGLRIVDVSDPSDPDELGNYDPPGIIASGVFVAEDLAYLTDAGEGIVLIDVSEPGNPVEICRRGTPGDSFRPFVAEGVVHVADGAAGIQIYRTSSATGALDPLSDVSAISGLRVWVAPNPASAHTSLTYLVPHGRERGSDVVIRIYDVRGALVRNLIDCPHSPGSYRVDWNGTDDAFRPVPSGVYFVRLSTGSGSANAKLVLTR